MGAGNYLASQFSQLTQPFHQPLHLQQIARQECATPAIFHADAYQQEQEQILEAAFGL
jgi:hypothetical protein